MKQRVPADVWNGYFKFCVERNPWDKLLSHYNMHAARESGGLSLDQYLARGPIPDQRFSIHGSFAEQNHCLTELFAMKNLLAELGEVFEQLNIPFDRTLGAAAKSEYRADRRSYQEVFNDQQGQIVEQAFAKKIELHGYRFAP